MSSVHPVDYVSRGPNLSENAKKPLPPDFSRYLVSASGLLTLTAFTTGITAKSANHVHIRVQQVKIYKNRRFVLSFTSLRFLTGFPTVILP